MGCDNSKPSRHAGEGAGRGGRGKADAGGGAAPLKDPKLLDKYTLGKVLGQGAFGVVYSCKKKGSGEEFAVKMIDQVETPVAEIKQEVDMLRRLAHPCIVKLHDVFYEKVFVCMVLSIYNGGDMIEGMQLHWKTKGMISVFVCQNITKMMFQSIDWLHKNNIVHRDLKGDNYLQDRPEIDSTEIRIYLSDFGTVLDLPPNQRLKSRCGTKTYWSPEFFDLDYGYGVDIWALGVMLFGMITGRFPFKGEEDVRTKVVKYPSRIGDPGVEFVKRTLDRDEPKRINAGQALAHQWLSNVTAAADKEVEKLDKEFQPALRETAANAGVQERRRELVERLQDVQHRSKGQLIAMNTKAQQTQGYEVFEESKGVKTKFEWWSTNHVSTSKFYDEVAARPIKEEDAVVRMDQEAVKELLKSHSIDPENFGKGSAKKFSEFVHEVQSGQARLMLDASKHKTLVRVVDVVLLRIVYGDGAFKKYLINTSQKYPDGRIRQDTQIPGIKKLPHENGIETAQRLLKERLPVLGSAINFNYCLKETFEEDEDSPSYPGVRTVYRKEIYEGSLHMKDDVALQGLLGKVGLRRGADGKFTQEDDRKYSRSFSWMTAKQCGKSSIKLKAPEEGSEISALVMPPIGYEEAELQDFLQKSNVDVSQFGKDGVKTLAGFSEELVTGESTLMKQADGSVIRVVEVVILKLLNVDGSTLVEVSQEDSNGVAKELKRLPAVKRRTDENAFWAAARAMRKVLHINQDLVHMVTSGMQLVEEQATSKAYGGLPTLYRRRIIPCKLVNIPNA